MKFVLHFFKSKNNKFSKEDYISYFNSQSEYKQYEENGEIVYEYFDLDMEYKYQVFIANDSRLSDLSEIDPSYVDVNTRFEINLMTPSYIISNVFVKLSHFAERFKLVVYNESLEDVQNYKILYLERFFEKYKNYYMEKNPDKIGGYSLVSKEKMNSILNYIENYENLKSQLFKENIVISKYHFLKNGRNELKLAIEWDNTKPIVFPPFIDYVFYLVNNSSTTYSFKELREVLKDFLKPVPGFSKNAYIIKKEDLKKVPKILKKFEFSLIEEKFRKAKLQDMID